MLDIAGWTPAWLARPSPASKLFEGCQVLDRRGTEVFVAKGNKIQWANLKDVKKAWDSSINAINIRVRYLVEAI